MSLAALALVAAACGGGSDDESSDAAEPGDSSSTEEAGDAAEATESSGASDTPPAGLPAGCTEVPFEIEVTAGGIAGLDGSFTVETAFAKPQPIVPDPDQGGDSGAEQSQEEFVEQLEESKRLAAETDLVLYAIWIADFPFEESDIAFLGGPDPDEGGTVLGLTIVPTAEGGFETGDSVSATAEFQYETFTTFAPMGTYLLTDLEPEAFMLYEGEQVGTAEILHLDDEWICVEWNDVGSTREPDGPITISGTVLAPLTAREELPFN